MNLKFIVVLFMFLLALKGFTQTKPAASISAKRYTEEEFVKKVAEEVRKKIDTVKKVGAEKNKLAPTALGKSALEFCVREFSALFDYDFTKQMETRLDRISDGKEQWKDLCRDTWGSFKDHYEELMAKKGTS
jgi:DNA topoisomerase IA